MDIFNAVQKKLDKNRIHRRGQRQPRTFLLTPVLYCGYCGEKMRGSSLICNHKTKEKDRWYACQARYEKYIGCNNKSLRAKYLETIILEIVNTIIKKEKVFYDAQKDYLIKSGTCIDRADLRESLSIAKTRLRQNKQKQREYLGLFEEKILSKDLLKEKMKELQLFATQISKEINEMESRLLEKEDSAKYLELINKVLSERDENKINLKDIIQVMIRRIEIKDKVISKLEFHRPFDRISQKEWKQCQNKAIKRYHAGLLTSDAPRI